MRTKGLLFLFLFITSNLEAGNYTVKVGQEQIIYCTANAPAGYITHAFFSLTDPNDAEFVTLQSHSDELYADIIGLKAKPSFFVL